MDDVQVKKRGRQEKNFPALATISNMKKGDAMLLHKKNWELKTQPGAHMLRKKFNREFMVQTLVDDTGWKITALS